MQSQLSAKPDDDPCDDVVLAPDVAPVAPSEEELSSVLQMAARYRLDRHVTMAPEITAAAPVEPSDAVVRPVLPRDTPASEDRVAHPIAPHVDAMVRPVPANDVGHPGDRRRKGGPVARALLVLLSTLIIGFGAASWKTYGDGVSKVIGGFVTQPVVASSQLSEPEKSQPEKPEPEKLDVAAQSTAPAASDQPAPAAPTAPAAPASATAPASSDSTQQLQSMARDLAALGQQVEDLKAEMAQMKASQQQVSHVSVPTPRPKTSTRTSTLSPRPVAAQTRRSTPPVQSLAPPQAAGQPAVPQVATAPYRSAPQVAAGTVATNPYYASPQRYVPPPSEPPPQATAEPAEQEYWAPRPPMPVR